MLLQEPVDNGKSAECIVIQINAMPNVWFDGSWEISSVDV